MCGRIKGVLYIILMMLLAGVTLEAQAQSAGSLTSFYVASNNTVHFFYVKGSHVFNAYSPSCCSDISGWTVQDITAASNGAPVAAAITGFYRDAAYPEHIFFLDSNGHVHELWSDSTAAWHDHDLTQITGSGAQTYPGTGLTSFYAGGNAPEQVIYENGTSATNANGGGTIHEMWLDSAGAWHDLNLTALTNAPVMDTVTPVSGFSTNDGNPNHAFYIDSQGSVHEMWFSSGNNTWHDDIVSPGSVPGVYADPVALTALSLNGSSSETVFDYHKSTSVPSFTGLGGAVSSSGGWSGYDYLPTY